MAKPIFKYLIPIYILWFIVHAIFFFSFIFSQIGRQTINFSGMGLLLLSHFLVIICGLAFMIYMIVDCALRKFKEESQKIIWIIVIVFLNVLGAIIYYYVLGKNPIQDNGC